MSTAEPPTVIAEEPRLVEEDLRSSTAQDQQGADREGDRIQDFDCLSTAWPASGRTGWPGTGQRRSNGAPSSTSRGPVTGVKPAPGAGWADKMAEAARLALPGEWLPAALPAVMSNTKAAVSAYAEAIADGIRDRLRLRLFE